MENSVLDETVLSVISKNKISFTYLLGSYFLRQVNELSQLSNDSHIKT